MSEMIDRLAKSVLAADIGWWPDRVPEITKDFYREEVRIVMRGMREPTEAMINAVSNLDIACINAHVVGDDDLRAMWACMIDEALK